LAAPSCIEVEEFEQVQAAPGTALLRLSARPSAGVVEDGPSTLVVDDGERLHRLAPLPSPPGDDGLLRFAYSAPLALIGGHTAFALELPDGSVLGLPAPTKRLARHELQQRLQAELDRRATAEEQVAERDAALEEAQERLLAASRALVEERARAAAELEQARAASVQAEQRAVEHERASAGAEEQNRSSQAQIHDHADRQRLAEARLAAATESREAAEARTAETQQAHLILQHRVEDLHRVVAENEQRVTALTTELEEAKTTAATLAEGVGVESEGREQLEDELASMPEQVEPARSQVEPVSHPHEVTAAELSPPTRQTVTARAERESRRPAWKEEVTPMILLRTRRVSRVSVLALILLVMLLVEVVLTLSAK
jgi:hypothetical protein